MDARLESLRWHWGEAYTIVRQHQVSLPGPELWLAQRRDTLEVLKAHDPEELHALIVADYAARPVPRE